MTQDPNAPGTPPPAGGAGGVPLDYSPAGPYAGPPPTRDEQTIAMLTFLLGMAGLFGWVGPLIVLKTRRDAGPYVIDQAKQVLNWNLTLIIVFIIGILTSCIFGIGIIINIAANITNIVLCILAAVKANQGVAYRFPFSIKFVK